MGSIPAADPAPYRRPHLSRRGFLALALPLAVAAVVVTVIAFAWPTGVKVERARWVDAGTVDALAVNEPVRDAEHGIWLVKQESGEVLALSQRDPHLGCTVPWRPDFEFQSRRGWFRNPCHGETYDLAGVCHFGPCPRGLDRFPVRVRDGRVQVDMEHVVAGPSRID
jgi:cytochrome b6-f complex iron-sulfur subunit